MALTVYTLGLTLSLACAILLYRAYKNSRARITFWSAWGFVGFALNNALLIVDNLTDPQLDLSIIRTVPALLGVSLLLYGLITDTVLE